MKKNLFIPALATMITLSSAGIASASSIVDDNFVSTENEMNVGTSAPNDGRDDRVITGESGGSNYSPAGTAYGVLENKSSTEFAIQMASAASLSLGYYFPPAAFAGVAALPINYLKAPNKVIYTKDVMQVRYSGKTKVIKHNMFIYSDSKRTNLIKSYWTETVH